MTNAGDSTYLAIQFAGTRIQETHHPNLCPRPLLERDISEHYERYGKPNTEAQRGMARERPQFNSGEHAIGTARQR